MSGFDDDSEDTPVASATGSTPEKKPEVTSVAATEAAPVETSVQPAATTDDTNTFDLSKVSNQEDGLISEKAQILFLKEFSPALKTLMEKYGKTPDYTVYDATSGWMVALSKKLKPCIIIASVQDNSDLIRTLTVLKTIQSEIKNKLIRVVAVSKFNHPAILDKLKSFGTHEIIVEPITAKSLEFKVGLHVKALHTQRKKLRAADKNRLDEAKKAKEAAEKKSKKAEERKAEAQDDSDEITFKAKPSSATKGKKADVWVFKAGEKKALEQVKAKTEGLEKKKGQWVEVEPEDKGPDKSQDDAEGSVFGKKRKFKFVEEGAAPDAPSTIEYEAEAPPVFKDGQWEFDEKAGKLSVDDGTGKKREIALEEGKVDKKQFKLEEKEPVKAEAKPDEKQEESADEEKSLGLKFRVQESKAARFESEQKGEEGGLDSPEYLNTEAMLDPESEDGPLSGTGKKKSKRKINANISFDSDDERPETEDYVEAAPEQDDGEGPVIRVEKNPGKESKLLEIVDKAPEAGVLAADYVEKNEDDHGTELVYEETVGKKQATSIDRVFEEEDQDDGPMIREERIERKGVGGKVSLDLAKGSSTKDYTEEAPEESAELSYTDTDKTQAREINDKTGGDEPAAPEPEKPAEIEYPKREPKDTKLSAMAVLVKWSELLMECVGKEMDRATILGRYCRMLKHESASDSVILFDTNSGVIADVIASSESVNADVKEYKRIHGKSIEDCQADRKVIVREKDEATSTVAVYIPVINASNELMGVLYLRIYSGSDILKSEKAIGHISVAIKGMLAAGYSHHEKIAA